MSTSALPFEILRNGLTPCYYLMLLCREHGELRTAIADIPAGRFHPCPLCNRNCEYTLLGEGNASLAALLGRNARVGFDAAGDQQSMGAAEGAGIGVQLNYIFHSASTKLLSTCRQG